MMTFMKALMCPVYLQGIAKETYLYFTLIYNLICYQIIALLLKEDHRFDKNC